MANGASVGAVTVASFEVTWTPTTPGSVTLSAIATDDSGAVTTSATVGVSVVAPPNVPPVARLDEPAPGASFVVGSSVTLRATASDADGSITRVTFLDGATPVGSVTTAPYDLAWTPTAI